MRGEAEMSAQLTYGWKLMVTQVPSDPLVQRFIQSVRVIQAAGGTPRNTEPWHAYAEQLLTAATLHMANWDDKSHPEGQVALALKMARAQTYLWTDKVEKLVRECPLPTSIVISEEMMPFEDMYFSYETAYGTDESETNWQFLSRAVSPQGKPVLGVLFDYTETEARANYEHYKICIGSIEFGKTYPDDFPDPADKLMCEVVLKRLAFLASPYIATDRHRLPREIRREMKRTERTENIEKRIAVVTLRREQKEEIESRFDGEGERDWKHHWWVSGHFRKQWCPSTKAHKVIWIAPHVKGPLDKPLLEKVYAVAR